MKNLLPAFQESLIKLGVKKHERLLLAVSGGLDSMVLVTCAAESKLDFAIAHVNFQLRGEESERDEKFVRQLASKYEKPFFIKKMDTTAYAEAEKISIQVAARNLRYAWFNELMDKEEPRFQWLLTAHHLDDQIETMLMHFFRGTGIAGLRGMPEKKGRLIRPLLSFPKSALESFARNRNLQWVEDSSNATDDYTRNYFRNQLMPATAIVFPDVLQNLEKNLQRFSEAEQLYRQAINVHKKKLLKQNGSEFHIPILLLRKSNPMLTLLFEIIREFGFTASQTDEVIQLMDSINGKFVSSTTHRVIKNRNWLIIAPLEDSSIAHLVVEEDQQTIGYPEGKIHLSKKSAKNIAIPGKDPNKVILDAGKIHFPLVLRKWKAGDYFYPLGMKKKKKLARFFIDQKLSKTAKEKIWVLVSGSHIIWVLGQRIDDRFALTPSTVETLQISLEAKQMHSV
jgi:tRNA(Ile)-lysidine synthase